jgi:hypothetical protein
VAVGAVGAVGSWCCCCRWFRRIVLPIGVRARVRVSEVVPSLVGGVGWGAPPSGGEALSHEQALIGYVGVDFRR